MAILDLANSKGTQSVSTLEKEFGKNRAIFIPCDVTNASQFEGKYWKLLKWAPIFMLKMYNKRKRQIINDYSSIFAEAVKKIICTFNNIDIFINNAGILDESRWEEMIDINVVSFFRSQCFSAWLEEEKKKVLLPEWSRSWNLSCSGSHEQTKLWQGWNHRKYCFYRWRFWQIYTGLSLFGN